MGASLSNPIELIHVQRAGSGAFRCAVGEMQGWRGNHEDAHEIKCGEKAGQFWVLDGHGGDEAALAGAPDLGANFDEVVSKGTIPGNLRIEEGMIAVDKGLRAKNIDSGCTVVGAMARLEGDGTYTVKMINAGDSRCIIVRSHLENKADAKDVHCSIPGHLETLMKDPSEVAKQNAPCPCVWPLVQESIDHKPSHPTEKARIEKAGGHVTDDEPPRLDGNLAVSRGLGDFEYKSSPILEPGKQKVSCCPDIYEVRGLEPGSVIVLCCDGVYDVHNSDDIARLVHGELRDTPDKDLGEIATKIIKQSLDRQSSDNITAMLVQLSPGTAWAGKDRPRDEMKCFEKLVDGNPEQVTEESVRDKYKSFLRRSHFPEEPVFCDICAKWFKDMPHCACNKVHYCNKKCQKMGWKRHKEECTAGKNKK